MKNHYLEQFRTAATRLTTTAALIAATQSPIAAQVTPADDRFVLFDHTDTLKCLSTAVGLIAFSKSQYIHQPLPGDDPSAPEAQLLLFYAKYETGDIVKVIISNTYIDNKVVPISRGITIRFLKDGAYNVIRLNIGGPIGPSSKVDLQAQPAFDSQQQADKSAAAKDCFVLYEPAATPSPTTPPDPASPSPSPVPTSSSAPSGLVFRPLPSSAANRSSGILGYTF